MNKTKIEYCDYTWNPITGCLRGCEYCYARKLARGRLRNLYLSNPEVAPGCDANDPFAPRYWEERLPQPRTVSRPSKIFAIDMGELFGPWLPKYWTRSVLGEIAYLKRHTFLLLTKQPYVAAGYELPHNVWVGVSIEDSGDECIMRLANFSHVRARVRFISYEPLLGPIAFIPHWADWIIIGAMTGRGAIKPDPIWVEDLIGMADEVGLPVFLKDNLGWPEVRREWPSEER